tara:strand:- start:383 stop:946 length:564 start_codon:yes stop_codon:yes gene_type:complete
MRLEPINKFLLVPSFLTYTFLILQQLYCKNSTLKIKISNLYLLNCIYLFETFIAVVFKKSILYNWKIKDYIQHHLLLSLFMITYYNYGFPLDKYFINTQKYCILINIYEITAILKNFNLSKKIFVILKFYCLYNLINLSYYEVNDSITYYKSINSYKKYLAILPFIAMWYHIFIVLPSTIKYIKTNI